MGSKLWLWISLTGRRAGDGGLPDFAMRHGTAGIKLAEHLTLIYNTFPVSNVVLLSYRTGP
jgi:hypothetical protein